MDTIFTLGAGKEDRSRVNIDELYEIEKTRALTTLSMFNRVLKKIHSKIKHVSRTQRGTTHCWYVVPEVILGYPNYKNAECTAYVIHELKENGFLVKYYSPNLLFVSWQNWTPSYVRDEIKKKTGISVDSFGRIQKPEPTKPKPILKKTVPKKVSFRDIGTFQPTRDLV